jgi:hypothetical protein
VYYVFLRAFKFLIFQIRRSDNLSKISNTSFNLYPNLLSLRRHSKMASIIFSDLHPTGAILFQDSESFMDELEEQGSISVRG